MLLSRNLGGCSAPPIRIYEAWFVVLEQLERSRDSWKWTVRGMNAHLISKQRESRLIMTRGEKCLRSVEDSVLFCVTCICVSYFSAKQRKEQGTRGGDFLLIKILFGSFGLGYEVHTRGVFLTARCERR